MVVKTLVCAFSELRVYPGHGKQFVRRDGQALVFLNSKCLSLYKQKKKPGQLTWTQAWRRLNKKGKTITVTRRRNRKTTKFVRAVTGATKAEIDARRRAPPSAKASASAKEIAAIKERRRKARAERRRAAKANNAGRRAAPAARNTGRRGR
eukprot:CAMPEP_0171455196 /NCGR_PEP_ID=MMETSP0945-20130129/2189_1 /TAXON_ID=109269 /ORGANISM="Vaucheria litorea, Strain CCMP2940" /LENGTH=150 /DNA_ID=CAMNT_0011980391 /DNA_START=40 /DNA_END=492 /DNA_ORIENTATION=+